MNARRLSLGFSLPELIAVLVVTAVLLGVLAPRYLGSGFNESRLYNETLAALRYAQSAALAMQRTVCVTFSTASPNTATLTYDNGAYSSSISLSCSASLIAPGGAPSYVVTAQGSAAYSSPPSVIKFDRLGRPYDSTNTLLGSSQTLAVAGFPTSITIEAGSGYVH